MGNPQEDTRADRSCTGEGGCGELYWRSETDKLGLWALIQFIKDGLNGAVDCGLVLLDWQLELDIDLGLFGQRHNFRKPYNHFGCLVQIVAGQDLQSAGGDQSFGIVHSCSL